MPEMKVAFEGIKGNHSEDALIKLYKSQPSFTGIVPKPIGFATFELVFAAVNSGSVDVGFVPLENSIAGSFFAVTEGLVESGLHIIGEFESTEVHVVCGLHGSNVEEIKEIHSHPYSFDQCRPFLTSLVAKTGVKLVQSLDTAASCEMIKKESLKGVAAIASASAAKLYGLTVIHEIDTPAVTRYALVSKTATVPERHLNPRTSVKVVLKNQVGAMMKAIACFSLR